MESSHRFLNAYLKELLSTASWYLFVVSFIQKIILGIYLSKEPEMCMHQGAFIIMVFMIGKKTDATQTVVGNLVEGEF